MAQDKEKFLVSLTIEEYIRFMCSFLDKDFPWRLPATNPLHNTSSSFMYFLRYAGLDVSNKAQFSRGYIIDPPNTAIKMPDWMAKVVSMGLLTSAYLTKTFLCGPFEAQTQRINEVVAELGLLAAKLKTQPKESMSTTPTPTDLCILFSDITIAHYKKWLVAIANGSEFAFKALTPESLNRFSTSSRTFLFQFLEWFAHCHGVGDLRNYKFKGTPTYCAAVHGSQHPYLILPEYPLQRVYLPSLFTILFKLREIKLEGDLRASFLMLPKDLSAEFNLPHCSYSGAARAFLDAIISLEESNPSYFASISPASTPAPTQKEQPLATTTPVPAAPAPTPTQMADQLQLKATHLRNEERTLETLNNQIASHRTTLRKLTKEKQDSLKMIGALRDDIQKITSELLPATIKRTRRTTPKE